MSCKEKVIAEFKGKIADSDMRKIMDDFDELKQKNPDWSSQELFMEVINKRKDYLQAKLRLLKQVARLDEHSARIDQAFEMDGITEGNAKDILYSFISRNGKYQGESLESMAMSVGNEYRNTFELLERKGFLTLLRDKADSPELHREVSQGIWEKAHGIKSNFKFPQSKEIVDIIDGLNKKRLNDLQGAGFDIQGLKGYVFSGSYDPSLIRKSGRQAFVDDVLNNIDVDAQAKKWNIRLDQKGVPNDEFLKFLDDHYESTSQADMSHIPEYDSMAGIVKDLGDPDRLNKYVSQHRNLIFKDGAHFYDFFNKYSGNNLLEAMERDIRRTAKTVSIANTFGTTPKLAIEFMIKKVNNTLVSKGLEPLNDSFRKQYNDLFNTVVGNQSFSDNYVARVAHMLKLTANLALLGKAAFKALLSDPVFAASIQSTLSGENYYKSWIKFVGNSIKLAMDPSKRKDLSARMNLLTKHVIVETLESRGVSRFEKGMIKAHDWYMKATGIPYQALVARQANASMAMMHLADIFDGRVDAKVAKGDLQKLKNYGFSDNDMKLMQAFGVGDVEGTRMMLADNIRNADLAKVREVLGNPSRNVTELSSDMTKTVKAVPYTDDEIRAITRSCAQRLGALANDYALLGSPSPTAVTNYYMAGMRDPSSPIGAVISLLAQYKAFGASIYRVYRNNAWHSGVAETNKFKQYTFGGRGAIVHTMMLGTMMGAGSLALSDLIDGKTPRDPTADLPGFLGDSVMAGGIGGLLMDYFLEDYAQGKKDLVKDLAGPVVGRMLPDAWELFGEAKKAAWQEDNKLAEKVVSKITRWHPAQNLWISKIGLDKLYLDKFRAWADPKYERKRNKSMRERSGKLYMQRPLF